MEVPGVTPYGIGSPVRGGAAWSARRGRVPGVRLGRHSPELASYRLNVTGLDLARASDAGAPSCAAAEAGERRCVPLRGPFDAVAQFRQPDPRFADRMRRCRVEAAVERAAPGGSCCSGRATGCQLPGRSRTGTSGTAARRSTSGTTPAADRRDADGRLRSRPRARGVLAQDVGRALRHGRLFEQAGLMVCGRLAPSLTSRTTHRSRAFYVLEAVR